MSTEACQEYELEDLLAEISCCEVCCSSLPCRPRPLLKISIHAKLLIVGQAPGRLAHQSGVPWNDPSGEQLRDWLGITQDEFYSSEAIGIMPVGFCYPGTDPQGGDYPPPPICAPLWHPRVLKELPDVENILLVGGYAQKYYLGEHYLGSVTETVRSWRNFAPKFFPLPHPSWRNNDWLQKNPWFANDLLPSLRGLIQKVLYLR